MRRVPRGITKNERVHRGEVLLEQEELDSGIVVGRGERDVRFWHLTFQEYLVGRGLVGRSDTERAERLLSTDKLYQPEWREVVLLMAGVLHRQGIEGVDSLFETILDQVAPKAALSAKARCAGLLSAIRISWPSCLTGRDRRNCRSRLVSATMTISIWLLHRVSSARMRRYSTG